MNKRCVVNVATGEFYCKMQERLVKSFYIKDKPTDEINIRFKDGIQKYTSLRFDLITWRNELPEGSRPHSESPYGFKIHAMKAAYEKGYTSVLWLDSPAYAVQEDISPIFDKMEKEGYYAMSHVDPLNDYVSDHTLSQFRFMQRQDFDGKNLPSGSCYGFDLINPIGNTLFNRMLGCERNGHFAHHAPHRHDETILALLLIQGGLEIFLNDPLFQSDSPECVIKSGGTHDLH